MSFPRHGLLVYVSWIAALLKLELPYYKHLTAVFMNVWVLQQNVQFLKYSALCKPEFRSSAPEKSYCTASGASNKCLKKLPSSMCRFSTSFFKIKGDVYFYPLSIFNGLWEVAAWLQVVHYLNVWLLCQKAKQKSVNEAHVFSNYMPTGTF